ncbi:Elongator subunit ELP2 KNAG_0G00800 [Huiozyma naganishii CBS 8797]|uniref:Elongator complex protein 2 n=1 Tax=Huiozyma naganishii (strain ATCC MYA-139 / BCRC 22969 / CBS 8797 / KCTC 17520 / NBRC 10181 / NCYC 3082 / Yp74L-3) TaxID=1071383 RepID=J7S8W0_HUIN7|nr:hypothetical protein KNAG_0G00800 [Kazachstania naganishii CBS 8797]CCK71136.1 hypothetical protein KNAG_0G00800 [Kazachstania naganishii CBS 8797]
MSRVATEAIFIGANQQNQVSDFDKSRNLVAFGAGKTIALWNPTDEKCKGVLATLKGHEADVTCVTFIKGTDYLVSASEDFHVKIWKYTNDKEVLKCVQTIEHYNNTIVTLTALPGVIAVGCADGLMSLWVCQSDDSGKFVLGHECHVARNVLPLSLSLSNVKNDKYLLAVGGTSVNIFIFSFTFNKESRMIDDCELSATLEGHEDWVKSLAFRHQETPGDYLLCSGSQDRYIRLWRIRIDDLIEGEEEDDNKLTLLNNKQYKFDVGTDLKVCINFDALIMGHDDWISSLQWHETKLQLLASTADTALMIWEPEKASGIWICNLRLGELSSKGASTATGSSGGFWSCIWFTHNDMDCILTNGRTGAWRVWAAKDGVVMDQKLGITGSTKDVTDISWSPNGAYLLSTSLDQTTRLYAPWLYNADGTERADKTWHEFSRPQIHGYDMICVEAMNNNGFVSGGDEKILRSFSEPKGVAEILQKFVHVEAQNSNEMPEAASVPVLGLSNKATDDASDEEGMDGEGGDARKTVLQNMLSSLTGPPTEDILQRHLLWPEMEKLYGHGYENTCLDISTDGRFIASACRSNTPQHAVIRIFDTTTWLEVLPTLAFHGLTITRLRFSKDSKYLLSVCRDRKWAVWERNFDNNTFTLRYTHEKPHTRIIWDGDWTPLEFGNAFVTSSRDRTIKLWRYDVGKDEYAAENSMKHTKPVTALSVLDRVIDGKLLVAAGLEDGTIIIYTYGSDGFQKFEELEHHISPADKIFRLRWSMSILGGANQLYLASASSDNSTRIYSVQY